VIFTSSIAQSINAIPIFSVYSSPSHHSVKFLGDEVVGKLVGEEYGISVGDNVVDFVGYKLGKSVGWVLGEVVG